MATKDFMTLMKAKTTDLKPSLLSAEENIKSQIIVLDQLRDLIPPLTDEESEQLEQNILKHGIKDPLTIWETTSTVAEIDDQDAPVFVLIDGHNRYRLSQQHGLDFRINLVRFATLDEVRDYMIDYQLGRRNLTAEQASYLRGMRYLQQKTMRGSNLQTDSPQMNVSETLAKEYGVSSRTIKRDGEFAAGIEKLAPALKREVLGGKQKLPKSTINAIAKMDVTEPISQVETILDKGSPSDDLGQPQSIINSTVDPAAKTQSLQDDIRTLANGRLDNRSCSKLLKKINELIALQSSK